MLRADIKRRHDTLGFIGLKAQATAVGLLQMSIELHRVNVLDDAAIERIKNAIACDINLSRPSSQSKETFEASIRQRLDILFAGTETDAMPEQCGPAVVGPEIFH
jgi:hypothetical protein